MQRQMQAQSSKTRSIGRILSGLAALFLLWDGVIKVVTIGPVVAAFSRLGYPPTLAFGIGVLELACLALYVIPRTSLLGAVLLTGFLGGATSTHLRVEDPFLTHTFFPVYVGLLVWGGLLLRDARLRELVRETFGTPLPRTH